MGDPRRDQYTVRLGRSSDGAVSDVHIDAVSGDGDRHTTHLTGRAVVETVEPLRRLLSGAGVGGRLWSGSKPIALDGRTGEHAELLLLAVKPLRRADRVAKVAEAVAAMGPEEAAYWHAKAHRRGGLRALRILITEGAM